MLNTIEEADHRKFLVRLRVYLLEINEDYLQSFRLNLLDVQLKQAIFYWIEEKFQALRIRSKTDPELKLGKLKAAVASKMRDLIELNVDKALELIDKWYDDSYSDSLIVGELSEHPEA